LLVLSFFTLFNSVITINVPVRSNKIFFLLFSHYIHFVRRRPRRRRRRRCRRLNLFT
jgi:hypothetical protein